LYLFRDIAGYLSKVADFDPPHLHSVPPLGVTPVEFRGYLWLQKTRVPGLSCGVVCVILRLAVLVDLRLDTDRQTDGRTDRQTQGHGQYRGCIASRGKNRTSKLFKLFCVCSVRPWLGPLTTVQCVIGAGHSMLSRVYVTIGRPSVRLSVRLSHYSTSAAACGGFAAERRADRIYRSTAAGAGRLAATAPQHGAAAHAGSVVLTAEVRG